MIKNLKQIHSIRHVLPILLGIVTRHNRYLPELDFNWRGNVVHSFLMCYYAVFWRREGIRHGGLAYFQDSTGRREVQAFGFIGTLLFIEHEIIRPLFRFRFQPVYVTVLQPAGYSRMTTRVPFLFSIAFGAGQGTASGTSTSPALTNVAPTGSNRLLITQLNFASGSVSVVPTFGSVASTIISVEVDTGDGNRVLDTYRLVAPSTSSGSITATLGTSVFWMILATTYTGIDQTTPTADESSNVGGPYNLSSPLTFSSTSNLNGSWQFASAKEDSAAAPLAATTGSLRQSSGGSVTNAVFDGNTTVASGSTGDVTITWTAGGQRIGYQQAMLRPSVAVANTNFFMFMT